MPRPLTLEELLGIFEKYNLAIWPMQVIAYVLGGLALVLAIKRTALSSRVIAVILGGFWLWTGIMFCMLYFGPRVRAGYWFGALFVVQALLFFAIVFRPRLTFGSVRGASGMVGMLLAAYAMIGYPVVGLFLDRQYPRSPAFGLTPCPLTCFSFGMLLLASGKVPVSLPVIPLLWSIGGVVPVSRGVLEDLGMIVGGLLGTVLILYRNAKFGTQA